MLRLRQATAFSAALAGMVGILRWVDGVTMPGDKAELAAQIGMLAPWAAVVAWAFARGRRVVEQRAVLLAATATYLSLLLFIYRIDRPPSPLDWVVAVGIPAPLGLFAALGDLRVRDDNVALRAALFASIAISPVLWSVALVWFGRHFGFARECGHLHSQREQ